MDNGIIPEANITRIDLAIMRVGDSIIAGAELMKCGQLYKVASLYIADLHGNSVRQALPYVCCELLKYAAPGDKLIIFHSGAAQFDEGRRLAEKIRVFSGDIDVRIKRDKRISAFNRNIIALANDALKRKDSVICDI